MTSKTIATTDDAIEMLRNGGADLASELGNISAAHADIVSELEAEGYEVEFTADDLEAAIRAAL